MVDQIGFLLSLLFDWNWKLF